MAIKVISSKRLSRELGDVFIKSSLSLNNRNVSQHKLSQTMTFLFIKGTFILT